MSTPIESGENLHFETLSVHAGVEPDPLTGSVMTPIYQTSTYAQENVGQHKGYDYSRTDNPTRTALQKAMAVLEGGRYALAFSSGMAAIDTLLRMLEPGDHVVSGNDVYGGTFRLFEEVIAGYGIHFSYVDTTDVDQTAGAIQTSTKLIWLETPTNPMLWLTDLKATAEIARQAGALLAVDNTLASPALQRPLTQGADIVIHSTTKYIGGHSDVVGGVIVLDDADIYSRLKFLQNAVGAVPGPQDCFLTLRGIKTLAIRMDTHCRNASRVASFLADHPMVDYVVFPGLESHPQYDLAKRQMDGPGGMVSFRVKNGEAAARTVVQETKLFTLAESLGGVESLIELPHPMTHASIAHSPFAIDPSLIRLSVGIENAQDLVDDLVQAMAKS
jgi:cystathionine beta-lyase/cystathionine gamma-synthase